MCHVHQGAWIWGLLWETEGEKTRPQWKACPEGVLTAASRLEMFGWPTLQTKLLEILPVWLTLLKGGGAAHPEHHSAQCASIKANTARCQEPVTCRWSHSLSSMSQNQKTHRSHTTWATSKVKSSWGQIEFSWTGSGVEFNLQLPKCLNYSYAWHNKDLVLAVLLVLYIHKYLSKY